MTTISSTFSANGVSDTLTLGPEAEDISYSITGPWDGTIQLEVAHGAGAWEVVAGPWTNSTVTRSGQVRVKKNARLRMRAKDMAANYVTNGTFAAATGWTAGSGWSIGSGVATGSTASTDLERTVDEGLVVGASYSVAFTTASVTNGDVTAKLGGTAGTTRSTSATFTETIIAGSGALLEFTGAAFTGTVDTVTVVPVVTYSFNDTDKIIREVKDDQGNVLETIKQSGVEIPGNLTVAGTTSFAGTLAVTGVITPGGVARTAQERIISKGAKVGATAGWTVNAATNIGYMATMAAGGTASTLVVPVDGLKVGDTITSFKVLAQIESAGGAVTLDGDLRKITNVAADPTDASIGAITQIAVSADTASAVSKTLTTPEVVAAGETFYVLVTGTTAASTDIILLGITYTVTEA